jgi:predicted transcriptional regulator
VPAPKKAAVLGELEAAVMNYFWSHEDGEAKAVHAVVGKRRGITLNTIQSTLKRLFKKGLLERDKVSHAHVYRAASSREAYHRTLVGEFVGGWMKTQADAVVSAFVDVAEQAGEEHLARLEALVAERRRRRARAES